MNSEDKSMKKRLTLSWTVMSMAVMSAFAEPYCGVERLPDLIRCLPAPPAPGSADFVRDVARYEWGKEQRKNPERAALARHDAVWSYATIADAFSKPFGMEISPTNTPNIWKVLEDSLSTTDQMRVAPKAFYHRRRPFAYFNEEPLCPKEDGVWRDEGSYPSGHTLRSMVAALVLAEINPARADEIFVRAMQYGENRVIAGAHWQSDVDMTRLAAAIAYSHLQTIPAFRVQMDHAKGEFAASRQTSYALIGTFAIPRQQRERCNTGKARTPSSSKGSRSGL
jgi:acid phosphatase (class A)